MKQLPSDFPTASPFQGVNAAAANQGHNAFVAKLNPDGGKLVYSTYLGGSGYAIRPAPFTPLTSPTASPSMEQGNANVVGFTNSNFRL